MAIFVGKNRLGFSDVSDMTLYGLKSEEVTKKKYDGNYTKETHQGSVWDTSSGGMYELPDDTNLDDDFVPKGLGLPYLIQTNIGDVFVDNLPEPILDDVPFFWLIPRSGGNSIRYMLSYCFKKVLACEVGAGKENLPFLEVFEQDTCEYVNVNTESENGIQRAIKLQLVNSGMAHTIFSSHFYEAVDLFNPQHKAKAFTLMRHPVDRFMSDFYQKQAKNTDLAIQTIENFLEQDHFEDNWMVRALTKNPEKILTSYDLNIAMQILKSKFLIGLAHEMKESVRRFRTYFQWKAAAEIKGLEQCVNTLSSPSPRRRPALSRGSKPWNLIVQKNKWDMKLYDYSLHLFDIQGLLLIDK